MVVTPLSYRVAGRFLWRSAAELNGRIAHQRIRAQMLISRSDNLVCDTIAVARHAIEPGLN